MTGSGRITGYSFVTIPVPDIGEMRIRRLGQTNVCAETADETPEPRHDADVKPAAAPDLPVAAAP
jgi:hypothetical protein